MRVWFRAGPSGAPRTAHGMARRWAGLWALLAAVGGGRRAQAVAPKGGNVSRLKMVNGCRDGPVWIAHMAIWPENGGVGPDPQNIKLMPGESYNFRTPPGLSGTRYWPKMGCDSSGNNCKFGDSGGPDEVCDDLGCAPPVDTKFEASFGKDEKDQDWVDISLVDGYTLPFRFELDGKCGAGFDGSDGDEKGVQTNTYYSIDASWAEHCDAKSGRTYYRSPDGTTTFNPPRTIDCSRLDFAHCPEGEDVSAGGATERKNVSLKVIHPKFGTTVGCYSPCSQLSLSHWSSDGDKFYGPPDDEANPYCCPTPPQSPESCREGPVGRTKFVKGVHEMCPGVYGYSYDDGMGLLQCPPDTKYKVTFYCPVQEAPRVQPNDPLLPPLKLLRSADCTTTTTTVVMGAAAVPQTAVRPGFVPEYVPAGDASAAAAGVAVPHGPEPANQPEDVPPPAQAPTTGVRPATDVPLLDASTAAEDMAFNSVTSTTLDTTGPPGQHPGVVVNNEPELPTLPETALPAAAAAAAAADAAPASTDLPTTAAPAQEAPPTTPPLPNAAVAAASVPTRMRVGTPPPAPLPAQAPEPHWLARFRRLLSAIGLDRGPAPAGGAAGPAGDEGPRPLQVFGFLALLTAAIFVACVILCRTCFPQQIPVYADNQYGQMQFVQGAPRGGAPGGFYSYG